MTRNDARMIAQELFPMVIKEMRKMLMDQPQEDEYMNSAEAARFIRRSVSFLKNHPEIPSTKVGSRRLYSRNELSRFVRR